MKTCLVFPPQIIPTSAPLGISLLKSYIQSETSHKVRNIDLNLYFHNNIINNFIEEKFNLHQDQEKNEKSRKLIKKAIEIFKSPNKDFFDPQTYNPCANEFLYLFENIFNANKPLLKRYINNRQDISEALSPFTKRISKESPEIIGFSILTTEQIPYTLALAKKLKQDHNPTIILGGATVRLFPERFLKYDFIDYVITGDGEVALQGLIEGKDPGEINNLSYKKEKIIRNQEENVDISIIPPPDFSDFDLDDYFCPKRVITTLTSRGCYWKRCTFCADYDALCMQYRQKDIQKLIEELRFLKERYKTGYFYFADEMVSPAMFRKISDAVMKQDLQIRYYTQAKPKEFSPQLLRDMQRSGCTSILWGVESASQRVLDLIDKGTNIEEIQSILKHSHEAGIKNAVYAFGGFPTETEEEYQKTLDWLKKNKEFIDLQFTGLFRLTENSRIAEDIKKFKITSKKRSTNPFDPTFDYEVTEGISQERSMELFSENYPFFLSLNKFSPFLGKFRDHILVYFSEDETHN